MRETDFDSFYSRVVEATGIESQQELSRLLGVNRSAVTQAKQKNAVPDKWLLALVRLFGLNPDWLATGRGPRHFAGPAASDQEQVLVPRVRARLCAGGGSFETSSELRDRLPFRYDWLARKGNPESMVLMDIMGNSMEPEIKEGDTVLIDQSRTEILAYGVYAVGLEDTVLVKRLEKRPGKLLLLSDNPRYAPIELRGDELDTVRILGRVIWVGRELA